MKKFKVWFTTNFGWSEKDYLIVESESAEEAFKKATKSNKDLYGFEVQSVEPLD